MVSINICQPFKSGSSKISSLVSASLSSNLTPIILPYLALWKVQIVWEPGVTVTVAVLFSIETLASLVQVKSFRYQPLFISSVIV